MPCVLSYRRIQRTQFSLSLKRKCSEGYRAGGTVYFIQMVFTWVELILLTNAWAWKPTPSRSEDTGASHWGGSRNVTLFSVLCGTMKLVLSVHSWCEGSAFFGKTKRLQYWKPQVRLWPKTAQEPDSTQWRKNPRRHNNTNQIKLNDPDPTSTLALVSSAPSWTGYTFQRDF